MEISFRTESRYILNVKGYMGARGRRCACVNKNINSLLTVGVVDQELSAKLESELQMEKDMRDPEELPESIKDYLDNGPFEVR